MIHEGWEGELPPDRRSGIFDAPMTPERAQAFKNRLVSGEARVRFGEDREQLMAWLDSIIAGESAGPPPDPRDDSDQGDGSEPDYSDLGPNDPRSGSWQA